MVSSQLGEICVTAQAMDKETQNLSFHAEAIAKAIVIYDCELQIQMKL